ncbi:MAG: hypothetical protein ACH34V_00055 [Flavobacterium sp.]|uniref:hypothetical protein n=1 Tax=Flavobacterium sp. TaxID=239 RepID=UPI00379B6344
MNLDTQQEINNLKIELIKIEVNCLKLMSNKLSTSDYINDIETISRRANELKREINQLLQINK